MTDFLLILTLLAFASGWVAGILAEHARAWGSDMRLADSAGRERREVSPR